MFISDEFHVHNTPLVGFEPTPSKLTAWRSTTEPQRQVTGDLFSISYLNFTKRSLVWCENYVEEKKLHFFFHIVQ